MMQHCAITRGKLAFLNDLGNPYEARLFSWKSGGWRRTVSSSVSVVRAVVLECLTGNENAFSTSHMLPTMSAHHKGFCDGTNATSVLEGSRT